MFHPEYTAKGIIKLSYLKQLPEPENSKSRLIHDGDLLGYECLHFRLAETSPKLWLPKPPSDAYLTSSSFWAVAVYASLNVFS